MVKKPINFKTKEKSPKKLEMPEEQVETFIDIHNIFCSFKVKCQLNLEDISERGYNVDFSKKNQNYIIMKLKQHSATAKIWPSGKILCMGSKSEEDAKVACRKIARLLQKLNYNVRFANFTIHNCQGSVLLPFHIRIVNFSQAHQEASYEPELHSGVIYKVEKVQATVTIYQNGHMIILAPSVRNVKEAVEFVYTLVEPFAVEIVKESTRKRKSRKPKWHQDYVEVGTIM